MQMRFGSIFRTCKSYVRTAIKDLNWAHTAYSEFWIVQVELGCRYTKWIISKSPVYRLIFGSIVLDLIYGPWPVRRLQESVPKNSQPINWSEWIPKNTTHLVWERICKSQGLKMLGLCCQRPSRNTTTHLISILYHTTATAVKAKCNSTQMDVRWHCLHVKTHDATRWDVLH